MTAQQAIDQSISQNETIHIPFVASEYETLLAECEDNTVANTETEFWGEDENGATWRVHMAQEVA